MILESFRLNDKVAMVTGAARGLGQAMAVALAEAGADVVLVDRLPLTATRARIEALGRRSRAVSQDLRELTPDAASRVVDKSASAMNGLHILVNNAGIIRRAPAAEYPAADWEAVLQVNLTSAFYLSQAAAKVFLTNRDGGKIINVASMLSFQGGMQAPAYAASKSGIAGLTRALANEWAARGINVNAIAPGYLETEVTAELRADDERNRAILCRIPAGRWGKPADVQGAVVFLASEAAGYLHGVILPVDGGWLSW